MEYPLLRFGSKNLAEVDLGTSLRLHRSSTPQQRLVIDFGCNDKVPHVAVPKAHQRSKKFRSPLRKDFCNNIGKADVRRDLHVG
jgi:hypothetical protein